MPIIKALLVVPEGEALPEGVATKIANAAAQVLDAAPGRVWVLVQHVSAGCYAENGSSESPEPVFLEVLHADLPAPEQLATEAKALAHAVGTSIGRAPEAVHIEYAAPGRGRVAFGGRLLT
jgi:phenylpyruvate tautomerase PptA (4-oxalocrotonate tautomerase family)